ncbi:putative CENPB DNA-binding domain-containing protein 1 [Pseudorca crassidens]|uniref:putative CENPB DNA-binding domain-containing protein 1 n=1 Tax=Pseudorca crassidens TaxID=82174 RepID=UPI00352EB976
MTRRKHKSTGDVAGTAKKHQTITMETKVKIIEKVERGEKMVDITHSYNVNHSTIGTILKNKHKIMEHFKSAVPMMLTIILKKCGKGMEMEKPLSVWMQDQYHRRVPPSLMLIQEKVKSLYEDLKKKLGEESEGASFNASHD